MAQIGDVRPSRRGMAIPSVNYTPDMFGAGIARGLNSLAGALEENLLSREALKDAEQNLGLQYEARENKLYRSQARADLARLRGELGRTMLGLQQDMPRYGVGYTNTVNATAEQMLGDWLQSIPEDLRDEFKPIAEEVVQSVVTSAFEQELTEQNVSFTQDWADVVLEARNLFRSQAMGYEDSLSFLLDFLDDSPLTDNQTKALRDEAIRALTMDDYSLRVTEYFQNPQAETGARLIPPTGSDIAASGMSGPARALLNSGRVAPIQYNGMAADEGTLDIISRAVGGLLGSDWEVQVASGKRPGDKDSHHGPLSGTAVDFGIVNTKTGERLAWNDPRVRELARIGVIAGVRGIGTGPDYMGGNTFHWDRRGGGLSVWSDWNDDPANRGASGPGAFEWRKELEDIIAQPDASVGSMADWKAGVAYVESRGFANPYDAQGKLVGSDRAYGKYQVMGANIPSWTRKWLGKELTPEQFLASPEAQEKVFEGQFGAYVKEFGVRGAVEAWFNGPNAVGQNLSDGGTTTHEYWDLFQTGMAQYAVSANVPADSTYRNSAKGNLESLDQHPGYAAGRYSIDEFVWNRAAEALGLEDFSPASQDRAAWWIAAHVYKERTGEDLQTVFASGDRVKIAEAQDILAEMPYADFSALGEESHEAFFTRITTTPSTPPSFVNDPRYGVLDYDDRIAVYQDGAAAYQNALDNANQAALAAQNKAIQDMLAGIERGVYGQSDIMKLVDQYDLGIQDYNTLMTSWEKQNEGLVSAGKLLAQEMEPHFFFDADDADQLAGAEHTGKLWQSVLLEQNGDTWQQEILPRISSWGYIPQSVVAPLEQMLYGQDAAASAYALRAMQQLHGDNYQGFQAAFGEQLTRDMTMVNYLRGRIPESEIISRLQRLDEPGRMQWVKDSDALMQIEKEENAKDFGIDKIISGLGFGGFFGVGGSSLPIADQANALSMEYESLYRYYYRDLRDHDASRAAALDTMKQYWGPTGVSTGGVIMRHPPEQTRQYQGIPSSSLESLVRRELSLEEETPFVLVSDHITEAEIASGKPPAYQVWVPTADGTSFVPHMRDQDDPTTGLSLTVPYRLAFDMRTITDMRGGQARATILYERQNRAEKDYRRLVKDLKEELSLGEITQEEYDDGIQYLTEERDKLLEDYGSRSGERVLMPETQPGPLRSLFDDLPENE